MTSYPPRRQVFPHRPGAASDPGSGDSNDSGGEGGADANETPSVPQWQEDHGSVNSAGTDRASNHNTNREGHPPKEWRDEAQLPQTPASPPPSVAPNATVPLPVPATVLAIDGADGSRVMVEEGAAATVDSPVKLTAEALARLQQQRANVDRGPGTRANEIFGTVEVLSNLSRSSSESGYLKNAYRAGGKTSAPSSSAAYDGGSGMASSAHFQPFGEDVSSLGSLAEVAEATEDAQPPAVGTGGQVGEQRGAEREVPPKTDSERPPSTGKRVWSEAAAFVPTSTSSETPPKDNLTGSGHSPAKKHPRHLSEIPLLLPTPVELVGLNPSLTPPHSRRHTVVDGNSKISRDLSFSDRLLPMGNGNAPRVQVDSILANVRPPSAPSPYTSPKPPADRGGIARGSLTCSPNVVGRPSSAGAGGGKKAAFAEPAAILTRSSSNASSCTHGTSGSLTGRIRLGVCAMDKKARSKPMQEILKRLDPATFEAVFFGDRVIAGAEEYVALRRPYLPNDLRMQRTLMDRRRVYDLLEESGIDVPRHVFMSRDGYVSTGTGDGPKKEGTSPKKREVYHGGYGEYNDEPEIDEHDDHIEVNGVVIHKLFVEKPVDADDHNIAIYYPSSAGGGCKKLFRKVGDRSSEFYPEINDVRRDGSYIYEEFIETQGTDVKMYTVGPAYGHAEARKSPAVDGKVERNADGKEVRFPVILTLREKEISRRIVLVFKQQVCGFDILRIQEGDSLVSYVCDVNGWSFVKNSRKYYDDCAQILSEHMLAALKPKSISMTDLSTLAPLLTTCEDIIPEAGPKRKKKKGTHHHHRGHSIADRVKMMLMGEEDGSGEHGVMEEENDKVGDLQGSDSGSHGTGGTGSAAHAETYEEPVDFTTNPIRNLPDQLATEPASIVPSGSSSLADLDDNSLSGRENGTATSPPSTHQEELRCVITIIRHGDRTPKQKLKGVMKEEHFLQYFHDHTKKVKKDLKVKAKKEMKDFLHTVNAVISDLEAEDSGKNRVLLNRARHIRDVLLRWKFSGLNRKLQMKPRKWAEVENSDGATSTECSELQLIVKWGGDLTKLGEKQAVRLGNRLRDELYPSNKDGGILRLHSTFRHDLKIKTSDEGRVMKTAAAFAKGMLELEGDIPPILVSLVHKEKDSRHMLDPSGNNEVKKDLERCKENINVNMQRDIDYDSMTKEDRVALAGPERLTSLHRALNEIGNPRKTLIEIHSTIGNLVEQLDEMLGELLSGDEDVMEGGEGLKGKDGHDEALSGIKLYKGETLLELTERWKLLQNKLYNEEKDTFDLSRVPDVHDNVRFDMLHNPHLGLTETLQKLYDLAKSMADEYGITIEEKRDIGAKMCHTLLEKINYDLTIARTDNQADMRYLINMDYSADLPINSMGRRVRSRLYFTSESHLHSMLNVLRFPSIVPSPLSWKGQEILANASELCYLTQVVIRLFEDTEKPGDDPKRFRVEILFSPGATATPLHMAELHREKDATRFDTEKLQKISIDGLTCGQVEEYFAEAIKEGQTDDEDDVGEVEKAPKDKKKEGTVETISKEEMDDLSSNLKQSETLEKEESNGLSQRSISLSSTVKQSNVSEEKACGRNDAFDAAVDKDKEEEASGKDDQTGSDAVNSDTCLDDIHDRAPNPGPVPGKNFWRSATLLGVLVGAGCLFMISRASKGMSKSGR
ncbi:hypothetical protein ACHAWF_018982 [Thalassiosira exigua]